LGIFCFGSLRHKKSTLANSNTNGLDLIRSNIVSPTTLPLVTVKKFDPNPILLNINKLKLYRIMNYVMDPKLFVRPKCEFEGENNGKIRNGDTLPSSQHFGIEGHAG
jgi:hypothetical protein